MTLQRLACSVSALALAAASFAATTADPRDGREPVEMDAFSSIRARGIGPALMSGRVGDIAVNPHDHSEWYVGVCSGNVWKTTNNGVTFEPVFENEDSYSIGCVAIDPINPNVVWVGSGENNSQRSVSWGDGVYKSINAGKSWTNVGLPESEHIGMITIDPRDSDTVFVAAQGPLWRAGGDRGLYKTTNGGKTWECVLHISNDTGVNEVHMDPRDPDTMYASAYQRRRRVWTLINGGPESGIYKSTDGGETWREITAGLPSVDMGRIGMDVSPANPDVVYAIIEAAEDEGGFFRSTDRGETWEKRSSYMTSSPQYYNEIFCDPHEVDRVYALDTWMMVTTDGGASFGRVPNTSRHVDDHALWIDPGDPEHMIVGCDGGVYITWDRGANWRWIANLPVTQFYRVALDNSEPFYYVYGGTQDNNTQGGPSRTTDQAGITNADWFITVGGDGFEPAVDPEDPSIVYSQWQYGGLIRFDRHSGEVADIQPRHVPGEAPIVFNWDSPLLISPHKNTRLYFAGDRLFRSEDRGRSWRAVSPDLTRDLDRNQLEVMGVIQKPDAVAKHISTSIYGNIVALDESPLVEDLLYVGTDDGLIQVSDNGGDSWWRIEAFPVVPDLSYVADVTASLHHEGRVFAAFDNHKSGDFAPYLLRSDDRGRSWKDISGDLPEDHVVYGVVEDHEDPDLLFVGTEFGAFYSKDGGAHWTKVHGLPTIAVKDVEIQRRENDLVMATFGRGFYVLDDYTPIREATSEALEAEAHLFSVRDAWSYIPRNRLGMPDGRGSQGASYYAAPNPPFGAVITYHLKSAPETLRERRKEKEKGDDWEYPTLDDFRAEDRELEPQVVLTIRNSDGAVVRRLSAPRSEGVQRVAWDLRYPATSPINLNPGPRSPWFPPETGRLAPAGAYSVTLSKFEDGAMTDLAGPVEFRVKDLDQNPLAAREKEDAVAFQAKASALFGAIRGAGRALRDTESRVDHLMAAAMTTPDADPALLERLAEVRTSLQEIRETIFGDTTASRRVVPSPPGVNDRITNILWDQLWVTTPPTQTQRDQFRYASEAFSGALDSLRDLIEEDIAEIEAQLEQVGAPWTPGRLPDWSMEDR